MKRLPHTAYGPTRSRVANLFKKWRSLNKSSPYLFLVRVHYYRWADLKPYDGPKNVGVVENRFIAFIIILLRVSPYPIDILIQDDHGKFLCCHRMDKFLFYSIRFPCIASSEIAFQLIQGNPVSKCGLP